MKNIFCAFCTVFISFISFSQEKVTVSGVVTDEISLLPIQGVKIVCDSNIIVYSDVNGKYAFLIEPNSVHTVILYFANYNKHELTISVLNESFVQDFKISEIKKENELEEIVIVAVDIAKSRETPIAFSKINSKQISEELGTRDLPMILNSTPGAYATEQGGGAGDARVSIRGFSQNNVAVLVDGVPVNDMENGQVYWSNWDGIGDITRFMQIQRGLGASKLAIVSVGGTMNIITNGIDQKMSVNVKQEVNDYGLYKSSFGYNSGLLKHGWGVTVAGARKWGTSYADATFDDAWSYFFKVQKKFEKHTFTFSFNGAPQSHGQRTTRLPIAVIEQGLAKRAGVNYIQSLDSISQISGAEYTTLTQGARGIRFNPNYGILKGNAFNEKVNFFHKPQFNLTHIWTPSYKINLTTVAYLSVGKGGGTSAKSAFGRDTLTGLYDVESVYNYNSSNFSNTYSKTEHNSTNYLKSSNNDHKWVGILSTFNYKISKRITSMLGMDARYYKGSHYQAVYDLMGGDYAIDNSDKNQPKGAENVSYAIKKVGDKISFSNDVFVSWIGGFGQVEYKYKSWSTFITGSVSETGYQKVDYFKKKDLVLSDTTIQQAVGYGDTLMRNGVAYTNTSKEARSSTTEKKWFLGSTIKGGANYNINGSNNVFINVGYLNIAPKVTTVFDNNNKEFLDIKNQKVSSIELGYGFKSTRFSSNVNVYYTLWKNKPPQYTPTVVTPDGTFSYNINGLDALHKGIELDFNYKICKKIGFEGLVSFGDWKTISGSKVNVIDNDGNIIASVDFSAKNVHVGDAAQVQLGGSLRYEIIKKLYIKIRYTHFAKNYANFDPLTLINTNKDRESWKLPNYGLLDLNFGYEFMFSKLKLTFTGGLMNAINSIYITDSQNGANFNAETSTVFVGMGRRLTFGLKVGF